MHHNDNHDSVVAGKHNEAMTLMRIAIIVLWLIVSTILRTVRLILIILAAPCVLLMTIVMLLSTIMPYICSS